MIYKQGRGYNYNRTSWTVDQNADICAGMIAFLATSGGVTVATTAASGTVPIGTFWKDRSAGFYRSTLEQGTFDANDQIAVKNSNVVANQGKMTDVHGTPYVEGTDYTVNMVNGIVTRVATGNIAAGETVIMWYSYAIPANQISFRGGTNYDHCADDTLGSSKITVVEGWAHIYTDAFDVTQAYALNDPLRSDAFSRWTTAATAWPVCGKVIHVPTVSFPWLGVQQTVVLQ